MADVISHEIFEKGKDADLRLMSVINEEPSNYHQLNHFDRPKKTIVIMHSFHAINCVQRYYTLAGLYYKKKQNPCVVERSNLSGQDCDVYRCYRLRILTINQWWLSTNEINFYALVPKWLRTSAAVIGEQWKWGNTASNQLWSSFC